MTLAPYSESPCNVMAALSTKTLPTKRWNDVDVVVDRLSTTGTLRVISEVAEDAEMVTGNESTMMEEAADINSISPLEPTDWRVTSSYSVRSPSTNWNVIVPSKLVTFLLMAMPFAAINERAVLPSKELTASSNRMC